MCCQQPAPCDSPPCGSNPTLLTCQMSDKCSQGWILPPATTLAMKTVCY